MSAGHKFLGLSPRPARDLFVVFGVCFAFRAVEYMLLRADQGVLGEAFVHKLVGMLILGVSIRHFSMTWKQLGFIREGAGRHILWGLLLGGAVYGLAYGIELLIHLFRGGDPSLQLYVAGRHGAQTAPVFFAVCIAGNLINVAMEEGVFRGLFVKGMESGHTFMGAALFSSILFGLWHVAAPVRSFLDGEMGASAAAAYACGYVLLSGLVGLKLCLLAKITGSLWLPMADHFFNNAVLNLLHVVSAAGTDELQIVRVAAAQTVSFLFVLGYIEKAAPARGPQRPYQKITVYLERAKLYERTYP